MSKYWDMTSVRADMDQKLAKLSNLSKEELLQELIALRSAIYPFVTLLSYFLKKDMKEIYAQSELFPQQEWSFCPQQKELPEDFEILTIQANYSDFHDLGAGITIEDISFLLETLKHLHRKTSIQSLDDEKLKYVSKSGCTAEEFESIRKELLQYRKQDKESTCTWIPSLDACYHTQCKHETVFFPDFKNCPYCGKQIIRSSDFCA